MIENEIFIKEFPDIKAFIGDLCREDSLVSNTAFMQDCVGCLCQKNWDPCNYFWDLHLPQILLQWTVRKLSKVIGGCGRLTDAVRKVHNCSLRVTGQQGWRSAWHSAFPISFTVLSASSHLLSFQTEKQCEHDYVDEYTQLSPGRRMERTVWPKGETHSQHVNCNVKYRCALFSGLHKPCTVRGARLNRNR